MSTIHFYEIYLILAAVGAPLASVTKLFLEFIMEENGKKQAYQMGLFVLILLAVLTIGEFLIAVVGAPWYSVLILIALLKAYYVVTNYMHLPRLFSGEESHE